MKWNRLAARSAFRRVPEARSTNSRSRVHVGHLLNPSRDQRERMLRQFKTPDVDLCIVEHAETQYAREFDMLDLGMRKPVAAVR